MYNLTKVKEERAAMLLSGIEMTIRVFVGVAHYLLKSPKDGGAGVRFLMAGAFSQDGLEQYFSQQRRACGGSRNPTMDQFLRNQNKLHLLRGLKIKRIGANTEGAEEENASTAVLSAKLPKIRRVRRKLAATSAGTDECTTSVLGPIDTSDSYRGTHFWKMKTWKLLE